ncbi:MAG: 4-aminobutyrate--2-oxoglutarate transaminase [Acidobacteriaceae bacterium]|nr:4-aminobutyrate--2-oxoglutarate transaminase [Acidobacteriaceae bacterium]MBV8570353.1 4-aminobutyrate--2-oxoglutarate transaminase [Acidobacteriaceae bacterium]
MGSIQLKTSIPGPKSLALARRGAAAIPRGISQLIPVFVARAEGARIEDIDGNMFLDMAGGIGCLNVGHRNELVTEALHSQIDQFLHTCFMVTPYESYVALAEKLNALAPGSGSRKTILLNSGAEGIENAVKIARAYTKRPAVICFEDGFHGRTLLTLSLTSKTHPYKAGFEPFASDIYRVPYGYCYRCSYNLKYPDCKLHCARHLEDTFKRVVAAESVAAIIAEPVLGEGGFVVPPPEWLGTVHEICRKYGILLIADEVQTGFARTGKFFAIEHSGVVPDLIVSAKSLGGGTPIAAVTGTAEIMDNTGPGSLGGTFGGNPLSCRAALAAIEAIEQHGLNERAIKLGSRFQTRAREWQSKVSFIGDVRGLGAMQAFEVVQPDVARTPDPETTTKITRYCYEHGVILVTAGSYGNVIRLLMPLVITDAEFDEALDVIEAALVNACATQPAISEAPVLA